MADRISDRPDRASVFPVEYPAIEDRYDVACCICCIPRSGVRSQVKGEAENDKMSHEDGKSRSTPVAGRWTKEDGKTFVLSITDSRSSREGKARNKYQRPDKLRGIGHLSIKHFTNKG